MGLPLLLPWSRSASGLQETTAILVASAAPFPALPLLRRLLALPATPQVAFPVLQTSSDWRKLALLLLRLLPLLGHKALGSQSSRAP